jgi:hypothetical protein
MPPSFIIYPALLVGWHIYTKDRLLPFDRRVGRDISPALVLSVLIIIAPYKMWLISSARLPSSALLILVGVKLFLDRGYVQGFDWYYE